MPKAAASPEGERARDAALALYRAARLPAPKVIVTEDPGHFGQKLPILESGLDTAFAVLGIVDLISLSIGGCEIYSMHVAVHWNTDAGIQAALGIVSGFFGVLFLVILLVRFVGSCLGNPFLHEVRRAVVLEDLLSTSGVLPERNGSQADLLSWNAAGTSTAPFLDTATGPVARLALDLRRATDGAVLGERHVLLLPAGATSKAAAVPAPLATESFGSARRVRRDVRRVRRLEPSEAQALFQKHGVQWCIEILGVEPFASDAAGSLYDVVLDRGRMCWLRVSDPATAADAWISVPNHVTTPLEAVAWTYEMDVGHYAPTLEG